MMKRIPKERTFVIHEDFGRCFVLDQDVDGNGRTWIYISDNKKRVHKVSKENITSTE